MTTLAGPFLDQILHRTRTSGGIPIPSPIALQVLSLSQALIQAAFKRLLSTTTLTLTPLKPLYDLAYEFSDCYQVTCLEDETIHLAEAKDWHELSRINTQWLRAHGQRPLAFAQIGFHFLAITPSPISSRTLSITYITETAELTSLDDTLPLPQEDLSFVSDMAEIVLLLASARGDKLFETVARVQQFIQRASNAKARITEERDV